MKTKAAILYKTNRPLRVEEIEIPELKRGQVLVKILCSGLCRSQINEIKGYKGKDRFLPHLLGHEGSGIVSELGPGVKKVKKNDYVVLSWIKGKGIDAQGAQYRKGRKAINSGPIATLSEFAVIAENRLIKIPKSIPPDIAALLGCAVPTGAGVVLNTLSIKKDSSLAVFGIGGIGASAVLAAKMAGCSKVLAIDVTRTKLAFARKLGATHVLNARQQKILPLLKEKFSAGIDYAIEASGNKKAMELAFKVVKDNGVVVIAGNLKKGQEISLDPFDLIKGKKIIGTWGGETSPDQDLPKYARAYVLKRMRLEKLITHRFGLEEINKAFKVLQGRGAGRIIIRM